jgi:uncharacterized protein YcbK (DUF882 family)
MTPSNAFTRRNFLGTGLAAAGSMMLAAPAIAAGRGSHSLNMTNGNTGETFRHTLIGDGLWITPAMAEFDWFARDWREDAEYPIDPDSLLAIIRLQKMMDSSQPMVLLSGYRTPKTNSKLRGAATNSLHIKGLAMDITQPGRNIRDLHRAAVSLKVGGVGYYPRSNFVHIDSGRIRHWNG